MSQQTKSWGGFELPAHLSYEQAVEHVLNHLHRCCGLLNIDFDRSNTEKVIRAWGLSAGVHLLLEATYGRRKEWLDLFHKHLVTSRIQISNRYR